LIDVALIVPVRAYREAIAVAFGMDLEFKLVAHASSAAEALARMSPRQPTVALLDFGIPDPVPVLTALRRTIPTTHLIGIGIGPGQAQSEAVVRAAQAGMTGFVDADQPLSDIIGAARLAVRGQSPCSPRIAALLLQALQRRPAPPSMPPASQGSLVQVPSAPLLTPRERIVAELAAQGLTNRQIAGHLVLGESTVKSHVHSILRKLGLECRGQIVLGSGHVSPP
jgi:two-component system, NarL family, nitrate/nitrite response regulator NarL